MLGMSISMRRGSLLVHTKVPNDSFQMCKALELAPGGPEAEDGVPSFLNKALDAPHQKAVANALELLVELGAMDQETNDLTALGQCLAVLSLEPRVGKMVIWSYLLGCVRVACNMAVAMSYKSKSKMCAFNHSIFSVLAIVFWHMIFTLSFQVLLP